MKQKSEAFEKAKKYITRVGTNFGFAPKVLRIDNGTEYINKKTKDWSAEKGIEIQTTAPYSPSQDGIAERFNRTLIELARTMLIAKDLPHFLWAEAVHHAAYTRNRALLERLTEKRPKRRGPDGNPICRIYRNLEATFEF